jgi:hypothetical protein
VAEGMNWRPRLAGRPAAKFLYCPLSELVCRETTRLERLRYARTPWTTHPFTAAQDVPSGTGTTHTKCVETAHTPEMAYIANTQDDGARALVHSQATGVGGGAA